MVWLNRELHITRQMGDTDDDYGLHGDQADEDVDDELPVPEASFTAESLRAPSPVPPLPVAPIEFGNKLSISEQLAYTKPVLVALLNGEYDPSRSLHIGFMKGGKSRNQVVAAAWRRGDFSHKDKEDLTMCIRAWMTRRTKRQDLGLIPHDVQVELPDEEEVTEDNEARPCRTSLNEAVSDRTTL